MQPGDTGEGLHRRQVSILIRPSGRMQPPLAPAPRPQSNTFQSSSDLQAGCNQRSRIVLDKSLSVSILIRPSGRMQPTVPHRAGQVPQCFNPHPTFRPDATGDIDITTSSQWFQSSSDLQAGCNVAEVDHDHDDGNVSILIRPSGRMQPPVPGFPIGSSRTSSTMPLDGHFWDEMFKRLTRAATRTRTSSVRGRQQWVRVTPRGGRRSRPRCPARIPRLVGPGCRAACKTGCCPASRR